MGRINIPAIPETTIAYIAGLFDGEGHVTIGTHQDKRRPGNAPQHTLALVVTNTDRAVIEWLRDALGCGHVNTHHRAMRDVKTCYRFILSSDNAAQLLSAMLPYLHIKRRQAELMIAFRQEYTAYGHSGALSAEAIARREEYRGKLRALNGWNWQKAKAG